MIKISALKRKNIDILVGEIQKKQAPPEIIPKYDPRLESALAQIADQLQGIVAKDELRFYAIKLFERDEQIRAELKLDAKRRETIADLIQTAEKIFDDESSSIIINARYQLFISRVMDQCVIDEGDFSLSISDRIRSCRDESLFGIADLFWSHVGCLLFIDPSYWNSWIGLVK